ncbi:MAG: thiamine-phosphate kinase [Pseudomonadales bacterium]|nr:thiamine-phosphate kinase [Pseudomonadales bacterium]
MLKRSPEFQIIHEFFEIQAATFNNDSVIVGIGDDCAVLCPTPQTQQVISVDTSIADRHFPADAPAFDIGYRALNVAVSDLAAMGATPTWFTLAISLNHHDRDWLKNFSKGLFTAAANADITLIGGDTTKVPVSAPLSITVQVHGEVCSGTALLRSQAQVGDTIYVSNTLGDAAAGLACYKNKLSHEPLLTAYLRPEPQIVLGQKLMGKAHSCVDISDGLLADLGHILERSHVSAEIDLSKIPLSKALLSYTDKTRALKLALSGGDDYQLLFTSALDNATLSLDNITAIGTIVDSSTAEHTAIHFINAADDFIETLTTAGFDHFHEPSV